jgi:hypothetical protein
MGNEMGERLSRIVSSPSRCALQAHGRVEDGALIGDGDAASLSVQIVDRNHERRMMMSFIREKKSCCVWHLSAHQNLIALSLLSSLRVGSQDMK